MLAWLLRGLLLGQALALTGLFYTYLGFGWVAGAAASVLAFLVLQGLVLALAYVVSQLYASPRPPGIGPLTGAAIFQEYCGFLAFFSAIQPFERLFMGPDAVGRLPTGQRPVLLVHGYMCNRGYWWWFRSALRARGHAVATISLETPFTDIEEMAQQLDRRIESLIEETGADMVLLVTHSMGGLVARTYLRRFGSSRIARFITLGGPHQGTVVATFGLGRNARQMEPDNDWLAELNRNWSPPVPTLSVWSTGDQIIAPQDSSRLPHTAERVFPAIGHLALAIEPDVFEAVASELAS
ncbi:MAG TPA: alpha/beta fold hydrolase [Beijerinckiaceae bacterium]|nr:alpha/beta fold hydrolase [Beijerinckiaceae bacterium]